jgi:hypothetical protein
MVDIKVSGLVFFYDYLTFPNINAKIGLILY